MTALSYFIGSDTMRVGKAQVYQNSKMEDIGRCLPTQRYGPHYFISTVAAYS